MMQDLPLGKHQTFPEKYAPDLLCRIPRILGRADLAIQKFHGYDLWRAYEVSWLNLQGKPCAAALEMIVPADSEYLVESKSLKLYLGSLNQEKFQDQTVLLKTIQQDVEKLLESKIHLTLLPINQALWPTDLTQWDICIDEQVIGDFPDAYSSAVLKIKSSEKKSERLVSHLLRSVCPVTGQPDWASVVIEYEGASICHAGLLRYIVSFRHHAEFHEQCVERILNDLMQTCAPEKLSVYAAYTRRGGIEINPFRSTHLKILQLNRSVRQ